LVRTEGPIHEDEAIRVLFGRVSAPSRALFEKAIDEARKLGTVIQRQDFLWSSDGAKAPVRWRGDDCPVTSPELIALEEFAECALAVLRAEFGLPLDALIQRTLRKMGFARSGAHLVDRVNRALAKLREEKRVVVDSNDVLVVADGASR
jgi:hypothetical protein